MVTYVHGCYGYTYDVHVPLLAYAVLWRVLRLLFQTRSVSRFQWYQPSGHLYSNQQYTA